MTFRWAAGVEPEDLFNCELGEGITAIPVPAE